MDGDRKKIKNGGRERKRENKKGEQKIKKLINGEKKRKNEYVNFLQ